MTWVAWRQGRSENVLVVEVLAALAALLLLTGAHMRTVFHANGLGACTGASTKPASCALLSSDFESQFDTLNQLGQWLGLTPGLVGVLLAAPLVLELDQGTYRLAWTQSITPRRWLTTRLAMLLFGAVLCGGLMIALTTWSRQPLDSLLGRMDPNTFDLEGVVPIAYTLFAATAVLSIGTVTRRTGLAVSAGFGAYVIVRLILRTTRQHLIPPVHVLMPVPQGPRGVFHAWEISHGFTDPRGHAIPSTVITSCFNARGNLDTYCLARHHVYQSFVYEPASRFWSLQAAESGIFLAISAAAIGLTVWWIKQRIA
jgi:hypothetical protein